MRAGEVFSIKWNHVDLENGIIHIADPKSGESRQAYITGTIRSLFGRLQRGQPEEYVFTARNSGGSKIDRISKAYYESVKRLGFNDGIKDRRYKVDFRTLRHTFASWLALQGTPLLEIKELMGHKTLVMTMRYAHLHPESKRKAVEMLECQWNIDAN